MKIILSILLLIATLGVLSHAGEFETLLGFPEGFFDKSSSGNPFRNVDSKKLLSHGKKAALSSVRNKLSDFHTIEQVVEAFQLNFNQTYSTEEIEQRKEALKKNLETIVAHNLKAYDGEVSYAMGISSVSDKSWEEIRATMLGASPPSNRTSHKKLLAKAKGSLGNIPDSIDYRWGCTPVKHQGGCGSCWAFAAIGALEAQYGLRKYKKLDLSEQELVDCTKGKYGNGGCRGGFPDKAYNYVKDNGGIQDESTYRYTAKDEQCKSNRGKNVATMKGYVNPDPRNERELMEHVYYYGPVTIAQQVCGSWGRYRGGIFDEDNCGGDYHAVVLVGYGNEGGKDYWIVRNSWGEGWGEKGYMKQRRNPDKQKIYFASVPYL